MVALTPEDRDAVDRLRREWLATLKRRPDSLLPPIRRPEVRHPAVSRPGVTRPPVVRPAHLPPPPPAPFSSLGGRPAGARGAQDARGGAVGPAAGETAGDAPGSPGAASPAAWCDPSGRRLVRATGKAAPCPVERKAGRGYTWNKFHAKWEAKIKVNQRSRHLGYHATEEAAARAYDRAARAAWGAAAEAVVNFPEEEPRS